MLAGNSLNYQFNDPTGNIYASNHYHCIYYAAFGYETYGETSSNKTLKSNNTADVPGKMAAGISNGKFLFVTEDGSVDKKNSTGVYESDYFTYGDGEDMTPAQIKETVVADISTRIDSLNGSIDGINIGLADNERRHDNVADSIDRIDGVIDAVEGYVADGYTIIDEDTFMETVMDDMIYNLQSDDKHPPVEVALFKLVLSNYNSWVRSEEAQGTGIATDLVYYVENIDTLLDDEHRATFKEASDQTSSYMSSIGTDNDGGAIVVYTNDAKNRKYVVTSFGTGSGKKDIIAAMERKRNDLADELVAIESSHDNLTYVRDLLLKDRDTLNADLEAAIARSENEYGQTESFYALLFHDLNARTGSINIHGIEAEDIMIDGKRVGEDLSLLSDHVYTPVANFIVSNRSDRDVIARRNSLDGEDGLRFTVNGRDLSDIVTIAGEKPITFNAFNDVSIREGVDVQLYTANTGNFSFYVDDSGVVHTTAPVVYSRPGLIVDGYLGYHSFDSFGYAEAANINSGFTLKTDIFPFIEDDDEEIIIRRDASIR